MKTSLRIAVVLYVLAVPAHAQSFTIDTLAPEQGCECDCFTGLSLANAKPGPDGRLPLIFEAVGSQDKVKGELNLSGQPITLKSVDEKASFYKSADGATTLRTRLTFKEVPSEVSEEVVKGSLTITHKGQTRTVKVTGFNIC